MECTIIRNCLWCKKEFDALVKEVKRGNGKFCSLLCSNKHTGEHVLKKEYLPNVKCAFCNKKIRTVYC